MKKEKKSAKAAEAVETQAVNPAAEAVETQAVNPTAEAVETDEIMDELKQASEKAKKMGDKEAEELVAELKEKAVGHRCMVVPFNTAEWVPGTIVGIIRDNKRNQVTFGIKLDDGRRLLKVYNSPLVKISETKVDLAPARRQAAAPMTDEELDQVYAEMAEHVGQLAEVDGVHFRIVGLLRESRSNRIYFKVTYTETGKAGYKSRAGVQFEDFDEEGTQIHEKFIARCQRADLTDEEKLARAEELVKKAEDSFAKAQENLENRRKALAALKEKMANAGVPAEPSTVEEAEPEDEDLL